MAYSQSEALPSVGIDLIAVGHFPCLAVRASAARVRLRPSSVVFTAFLKIRVVVGLLPRPDLLPVLLVVPPATSSGSLLPDSLPLRLLEAGVGRTVDGDLAEQAEGAQLHVAAYLVEG